jgi:hypothetical protein
VKLGKGGAPQPDDARAVVEWAEAMCDCGAQLQSRFERISATLRGHLDDAVAANASLAADAAEQVSVYRGRCRCL